MKWASAALAAKPFAEVGGALIGADERGALRVLDAATGKPFASCDAIPGVGVQLLDGLRVSHTSWGTSDGKRAWISWSSARHRVSGMPPRPGTEEHVDRGEAGVHEIDVATCRAKPGTDPYAARRVPRTHDIERTTPSGTRLRLISGALGLERRRGDRVLPPLEGPQRAPGPRLFVVTADLRHVIVGDHASSSFRSVIFDVETGAAVASVTLPSFPASAVLVGRKLVMHDRGVRMLDLDTQAELWTRDLRETRYDGPLPP